MNQTQSNKQIHFSESVRELILDSVNELANAVSVTLGPRGRNVIIGKDGVPHITKDGVTVAKSIKFSDPSKDLIVSVIQEASQQTADNAGDGTTTSTVISQAIIQHAMKLIRGGKNPIVLKREMDIAVSELVSKLKEVSNDVSETETLKQIATISANGDTVIGGMIADALNQIGNDGVIEVQEGNGIENELDIVEGLEFDKGYLSHHFITDSHKMQSVLDNPLIFLYSGRLSTIDDVNPLLEKAASDNRPLLVIADEIESQALAMLIVNTARGLIKGCAVKSPGFGDKLERMYDIAALTGGDVVGTPGLPLEAFNADNFGEAEKVIIGRNKTVIVNGMGTTDGITTRIEQIKTQMRDMDGVSDFEKDKLNKRLSSLTGGMAVMRVGGQSEIEMKERKDRIDDALLATRAAIEEGYVAGGGSTLYYLASKMNAETDGGSVLISAITSPIRKIMENAGIENVDELLEHIVELNYGYDISNETPKLINLIEAGIIDPTKVVRVALEKAVSVAGTLLTTNCMVVEEPTKNDTPIEVM